MTTIIRVKRFRGEDPVEALVLSCKRKKTEDSENCELDVFKKILNFSGTVEEKDNNITKSTVQSFSTDSKYLNFKTHTPEIKSKQRKEWKERSNESRFNLLSVLRTSSIAEDGETDRQKEEGKIVTILDVSKENKKSPEHNADDSSYVYDLYSTNFENESDFNDQYMENLLSIQPLETELEFRNGEDCYDEVDPDEDDSNDENNWRNDYPDTDSDMDRGEDEDEDILSKQLKGFHLDYNSVELSSDSGEEKYLNDNDEENYHFYEAEDFAGKNYARYKANAMKFMMEDEEDEDESEDEFHDFEDLSYHENSE